MYLESRLTADDVLAFAIPHVVLATGGRWRTDGAGRNHRAPLAFLKEGLTLTPDDLMAKEGLDRLSGLDGPVVIFDDDQFYLASVLAERIRQAGHDVVFVTPAAQVAPWSEHTLEQVRIQTRLIELGVAIRPHRLLADRTANSLEIACVFSGRRETIACAALVPVTARLPEDGLWHDLEARRGEWAAKGVRTVTRIGDCLAPGLIAAAVYSGHRYAREFGEPRDFATVPFLREDRGFKGRAS
jgi:dimethylamine/trimethylamine dehydrogenase